MLVLQHFRGIGEGLPYPKAAAKPIRSIRLGIQPDFLLKNKVHAQCPLFTFIYSKRVGTKAASYDDSVDPKEKSRWFRELFEVQACIKENGR